MEDSRATYRMPEGFNPWNTLDALLGLADALRHRVVLEGADLDAKMEYGEKASLDGLVLTLHEKAHAVHDYFTHLGDVTRFRLPLSQAELDSLSLDNDDGFVGVRQPRLVYGSR